MPLTNKVTNEFRCDAPECDVEFDYNPQPRAPEIWPPRIQVALSQVIAVTHALSQTTKFFCCKEHAIEGMNKDVHLPPMPPKIQAVASDAEVKAAIEGAKAVREMKSPKPS